MGYRGGVSSKGSMEIGHCSVPKGQHEAGAQGCPQRGGWGTGQHGDGALRGLQKAQWCAGEQSLHGSVGLRHKGVPKGTDREQGVLKGPDEAQKGPQVLGWVLSGSGASMERGIPI